MSSPAPLKCPLCGQEHRIVPLRRGDKARCARCDTLLAMSSRLGPEATLCFALTGLILFLPAMFLPLVGAEELGDRRISVLLTGVGALWGGGMRALSLLVLVGGTLFPAALLAILALLYSPVDLGRSRLGAQNLTRAAHLLRSWAFPEVQVLAVLVGVVKLGSLVRAEIGPGFWCYCGVAVSLLLAQHGLEFAPPGRSRA